MRRLPLWLLLLAAALAASAGQTRGDEPDTDGDGWTDAQEIALATRADAWCPYGRGSDPPKRLHPVTLEGWSEGSWPPDLTNDGRVNVGDLLVYNWWITTHSDHPDGTLKAPLVRLDLNRDGHINVSDWLLVAQDMGRRCQ